MRKILLLTFIFTLTSIYTKTDIKASGEINIAALKGPTGLSMVKLIHNNDNFDRNMNINYKIVNSPQLIVSGLLSGEYDIATLPTNLAAILYNKRSEYVLISVTGNGSLYLLSSRNDIKSWKDLKGKKIHNIARSSTPDFLFNHFLKSNNVKKNELDIDFKYNHLELAQVLIAGKVENGILPEPLATKVLTNNRKVGVVLDFQKEYKKLYASSYPLSCIVASKRFIIDNPVLLREFLLSVEASIHWVNANPYEAGVMGNKIGLGITGELITEAIIRLNLKFKTSIESKNDLLKYYKVLYSMDPKSVGGKIPPDEFFLEKN